MTPKRKEAARAASEGVCHICGEPIDFDRDEIDYDHVIPLALGGEDGGTNLCSVHRACHRGRNSKTSRDQRVISKAKRVAAKHEGTYRESRAVIPGSKRHHLKKKPDGSVIDRRTGKVIREGRR